MTLTALKRDLYVGRNVVIEWAHDNNSLVGKIGIITHVQGNAVVIDRQDKKRSWLCFPPASLIDYNGDIFTIYEAGKRELTDKEAEAIRTKPSNLPENAKQLEVDMLTDGSTMFRRDKAHFEILGMEYLFCGHKSKGKRYSQGKVIDDAIKGEKTLCYKILK